MNYERKRTRFNPSNCRFHSRWHIWQTKSIQHVIIAISIINWENRLKKTVLLKLNRTVQVIPFITERKISNKKLQITNATQTLTGANEHKYTQTSLFSASTKLNCRFETIPTENAENVTFNVLYDTFSRRTTRDWYSISIWNECEETLKLDDHTRPQQHQCQYIRSSSWATVCIEITPQICRRSWPERE